MTIESYFFISRLKMTKKKKLKKLTVARKQLHNSQFATPGSLSKPESAEEVVEKGEEG
jgi:hypothetical protein